MARIVAFVSTACLICLLAGMVLYLRFVSPRTAIWGFNSQVVVKEVRQLNELVTVKYSVEKVVGMKEQKSPVGEESILLLVQGTVLAGVDLSKLTPDDVTMHGRSEVSIRLARPHIQEAFLEEKFTKVWDRSITWWTPWVSPDVELEHKARLQAIEDVKEAALGMGILRDAQKNAETSIRTLLQAFGVGKALFDYSS